MIDKNNNIVNWNKKAEEMLGLEPETSKGMNLFNLDLIKKERILEAMKKFEHDKKPLSVKSISIRDKRGDVHLTNLLHTPMIDNKGEFQGAIILLEDVSDTEEMQAEIRRREEEFETLDSKFKDVYTKLQIANKEKLAVDEHFKLLGDEKQKEKENLSNSLEKKQKELESLNISIESRSKELDIVTIKLGETKSYLQTVENDIARKKTELEHIHPSEEALSKAWREKLKIYDEIDKSLGITSGDILKTKKIEHKTEET